MIEAGLPSEFCGDIVPGDGPINDITSWLAWENGVLWQCAYFGMSRDDGRNWQTWGEGKSPLLSNFTQFVLGLQADDEEAWIATSKGLSRGILSAPVKLTRLSKATPDQRNP